MTEYANTVGHTDLVEPRTRRRRWVVALVTATALVAGSLAAGAWLRSGEEFPRTPPRFFSTLPSMSPSDTKFSISFPIEDKGRDIEILEVEARRSPNVEYLGASAIWPRDLDLKQGQPSMLVGYPTNARSYRPAFGLVVPAAELEYEPAGDGTPGDLFVQVGFRMSSGDVGGVNGLKVRYRLGDETKSQYFQWGAIVCVKPHRCGGAGSDDEQPGDRDFDERTYVQLGLVSADEYEN